MALTDKKYSAVHNKTGSEKAKLQANFDDGHIETFIALANDEVSPEFGALIYQIQQMQDELDYLRTEISSNKDKSTFPGFGTSNSTALVGDTKLVNIGANTTLTFSDMLENRGAYSIRLTASRDFGGKTGVVTKSIDLRLV